MDSPLNSSNGNRRLETVAAGVGAGAGTGDLGCQGNPATEPEAHGDDLDGGDHEFVRHARQPEGGQAEVGDGDDGGPAAVKEHVVDCV